MSTSVITPQETSRLHRWAMWRMTVNEGIISCIKDGETARVFYPHNATPAAPDARRSITPIPSSAALEAAASTAAAEHAEANELVGSEFPFITPEQMSLARTLNLREKYGSNQGLSDDSYFIFGIPRINVTNDIPEVTSTSVRSSVYGSFSDFALEDLNNSSSNNNNNNSSNNKYSSYYTLRPGDGMQPPGNTALNLTLSEFGPSLDMQSLASHDTEVQKINGYGREEWKAPVPVSPVPRLNLYSIEEEFNNSRHGSRLPSSNRFRSIPSPPYGGHNGTREANMTDRSDSRFHNTDSSSYYATPRETTSRSQISDRGLRLNSSAFVVRHSAAARSESAGDPYSPNGRFHGRDSPTYDRNTREAATAGLSPTGLFHDSSSLFINTVPRETATDPFLLSRSNSTAPASPSWKTAAAAPAAASDRYSSSDRILRRDSSTLFDNAVPREANPVPYFLSRSTSTATEAASPSWKAGGAATAVDRNEYSSVSPRRESSAFSFDSFKPEVTPAHRYQDGSVYAQPSSSSCYVTGAGGEVTGDRRFSASSGGPRRCYARSSSFPYGVHATETNGRYSPANNYSVARGVSSPAPLNAGGRIERSSSTEMRSAQGLAAGSRREEPDVYPPFSPSRYAASQVPKSHGYSSSPAVTLSPTSLRMHADSPSFPGPAVTRPQSYPPSSDAPVSPTPSSVAGYGGRMRPTNILGDGMAESVKRQAYYDWTTPTVDKKVLDWPQVRY